MLGQKTSDAPGVTQGSFVAPEPQSGGFMFLESCLVGLLGVALFQQRLILLLINNLIQKFVAMLNAHLTLWAAGFVRRPELRT